MNLTTHTGDRNIYRLFLQALACLAVFTIATAAVCADQPVTMAPPVAGADQGGGAPGGGAASSVFNWADVPQNQQVPIQRATFDAGGYQLYDSDGETIIVPFENQNLYVMKFAPTDGNSMFLVNEGATPVLYVPNGGYIENATVSGARWYPFTPSFHPAAAVYVGPAPSWDAFVAMGWYPGMVFYGGYWGHSSFLGGGVFVPMGGLFFVIGGYHYYGWDAYHSYYRYHPGWYHPGYFNRSYYRWGGHPGLEGRVFVGARVGPGFGRDRGFGPNRRFGGNRAFRDGYPNRGFGTAPGRSFNGRTYNGANGHPFAGGNRTYGGSNQTFGGNRSFSGGNRTYGGANRSFRGGRASGGGNRAGGRSKNSDHPSNNSDH